MDDDDFARRRRRPPQCIQHDTMLYQCIHGIDAHAATRIDESHHIAFTMRYIVLCSFVL